MKTKIQVLKDRLDQKEVVVVRHLMRNFIGIITKVDIENEKVWSTPVIKQIRDHVPPLGIEDFWEMYEVLDFDYKEKDRDGRFNKTWIIRYDTYPNKPILLLDMKDYDNGGYAADGYAENPIVFRTDTFEPFHEVYSGWIYKKDITILKVV